MKENKIVQFKDTQHTFYHEDFQKWRRQNDNGFFVNVKSGTNILLHRTICPHLGDSEWERETGWGSLTRSRKICSADLAELQLRIAEEYSTSKLKMCADCKP
jgi:hypothetical protein